MIEVVHVLISRRPGCELREIAVFPERFQRVGSELEIVFEQVSGGSDGEEGGLETFHEPRAAAEDGVSMAFRPLRLLLRERRERYSSLVADSTHSTAGNIEYSWPAA